MKQFVSYQEARFYDVAVPDWPGEIDFYRGWAREVNAKHGAILEVACGTGRVALQLAQEGVPVTGLELSPDMLAVARQNAQDILGLAWLEADMRAFDIGKCFELIIIPGHSFQFMLTPEDQLACLACIRSHMSSDGVLIIHVDHQDPAWLGRLSEGQGTGLKLVGEFRHGLTETPVRHWNAWTYERSTQTASVVTVWEILGEDGAVKERYESPLKHCHCIFRFEMEHLLARAGFEVQALYGDFYKHELKNTSSEMIWVAQPFRSSSPQVHSLQMS